jgi:hypothetical protein
MYSNGAVAAEEIQSLLKKTSVIILLPPCWVLPIYCRTIKRMLRCGRFGRYAGVAELVDAPGLGPGDCKVVGVQVPSPAPSGR